MHLAQAVFEHRWTAPVVLVAGLVALAAGFLAVHGEGGDGLQRIGGIVFLASCVRIGTISAQTKSRLTYRYVRCEQRTDPALAPPMREDANL